jgi:phosphoribosylformimino-5-aminoimidazole carboxamide ribotide isomerase
MNVLPAIDLLKGNVVTLVGGVLGSQTVDLPEPLAVYQRWIREGADWVHVVDLDAAFGKGDHRLVVESILEDHQAKVQVGGGVRSLEKLKWLIDQGADRVIVGTKGIEDPAWLADVAQQFPDRILLAVDAKDGKIVTRGWTRSTGKDVVEVVRKMSALPLAGFLFTSVGVEGKLQGLDYDAVVQVFHASPLPLVVAGGVTTYDDLKFCKGLGVDGVVLGAALYQDRIRLPQAMNLVEEL